LKQQRFERPKMSWKIFNFQRRRKNFARLKSSAIYLSDMKLERSPEITWQNKSLN